MTAILIFLLLVSNISLATIVVCRKNNVGKPSDKSEDDKKSVQPDDNESSDDSTQELSTADVVGKSVLDIDEWRKIIREEFREVVPLIIKEFGTPADAGWDNEEYVPQKYRKVVANEDLEDVFSNKTASELTGEAPTPAPPMADGIDFRQMDTTMKVLKGKSDNPEDIETTKRVLSEAGDAAIFEVIKLDPVIQKRILMIECHIPKEKADTTATQVDKTDTPKPKKIVYHADINTEGIDAIDFNIYH